MIKIINQSVEYYLITVSPKTIYLVFVFLCFLLLTAIHLYIVFFFYCSVLILLGVFLFIPKKKEKFY